MKTTDLHTDFKSSKVTLFIVAFVSLLVMYRSQRILWVRPLPELLFSVLAIIVFSYYIIKNHNLFRYASGPIIGCMALILLLFCYDGFWVNELSFLGVINSVAILLCTEALILFPNNTKYYVLRFIIVATQIMVGISILGFFALLCGVELPHYTDASDPFYIYDIYYLFNLNIGADILVPRFAGTFLEPGHLGTMCIFLLYIDKFRVGKFGNFVLLLGALFSLSLAAYGLLVISVVICLFNSHKYSIILLFCSLFALGWVVAYNYNGGDNIIYQLIYHRFEFKNGDMVGNNRTSSYFDSEFDKYIGTNEVWFGKGNEAFGSEKNASQNITIGCAGYKRYFFTRGIIGSLMLILFLILYCENFKTKRTLGFFIIFIIANLIRDYPLKPIWLFIYILALPYLSDKCEYKNDVQYID